MCSGKRASADKQRAKKANQASLLSVENSYNSSPKKIVEVKDRWVKVRVTMGSGAACHEILEATFPRVKLERKTSPKKFVAANGELFSDLGEKNIPFKTKEANSKVHNIQECECCQTSYFNAKSCPSRKHCRARWKESAHWKHSRREQRCVHNGHVDLLR